jgi:hypothetical protein
MEKKNWNAGIMEYWNVGVLSFIFPTTIPSFQYSNIPILYLGGGAVPELPLPAEPQIPMSPFSPACPLLPHRVMNN